MQLACPECSKALNVDEQSAGLRINCPACGSSVHVPEQHGAEIFESDDLAVAGSIPAPVAEDTKTCPMCGGKIKKVARKCRFCGEHLSDMPGEDDRGTFGVWRDGNRLVMSKDAQLPYICIKTNRPATAWLRRKLYWHHPAIYLTILISIWIYVIVALIVRKKADIQVGLSAESFSRRRWSIAGGWLGFLLGAGLFVVGIAESRPTNDLIFLVPAGLLIGLIAAAVGATLASIVRPTRITDKFVWLKGAHPEFLASLPAWPGDGA